MKYIILNRNEGVLYLSREIFNRLVAEVEIESDKPLVDIDEDIPRVLSETGYKVNSMERIETKDRSLDSNMITEDDSPVGFITTYSPSVGGGKRVVRIDSIDYISAGSGGTTIVTKSGEMLKCRETQRELITMIKEKKGEIV